MSPNCSIWIIWFFLVPSFLAGTWAAFVCKWSHYTQNKSLTCNVPFTILFARRSFQAFRTSIQFGISVLVVPFLLNPTTLFVLVQVARCSAAARTAVSLKWCLFGSLEVSSVWCSNSSNNPWAKSILLAIQWANDQTHLNICSLMLFSGILSFINIFCKHCK